MIRYRQLQSNDGRSVANPARNRAHQPMRGGLSLPLLGAACLIPLGAVGCQRMLTITQSDYVNTGIHYNRPVEKRDGAPLEVTIVSVYPGDLKNELNSGLKPDSGVTAKEWYLNRPEPGDKVDDEGHTRFRIPSNQIFLLTDQASRYGKRIGSRLRGAKLDGKSKVVVKFDFNNLFSSGSVLYIFPKFIGPNGDVLPVPPVKFDPPGDYRNKLFVEIGVDYSRQNYGQFIAQRTERHLHKDRGE